MRRLLICHCLFNMSRSFLSAILVVYLLGAGISLETLAFAKALQLFITLVLNIPTGWVADRFGNKVCVIIACVCASIYLLLLLQPNATSVVIGEAFNGLALVFYKGAYEAWAFRYRDARETSFSLVFRSNEMMYVAMMIAGVAGALLTHHAIYASVILTLVSALLFLGAEKGHAARSGRPPKRRHHGPSGAHLMEFIPYVLIGGVAQLLYQFWPVYLQQAPATAMNQKEIGITFAACMLVQALAARATRHLRLSSSSLWPACSASALLAAAVAALWLPSLQPTKFIAALAYVCLATMVGINTGMLFAKACDTFAGDVREGSLISALDGAARLCGAALLALIGLGAVQDIRLMWLPILVAAGVLACTARFWRENETAAVPNKGRV